MKVVALSAAKAKLSGFVDEVRTGGEPIVILKHDKEVAVLVEVEQFRRLQQMEDRWTSLQLREALRGRKYKLREVLRELKLEV